jgi:hypothetical protein
MTTMTREIRLFLMILLLCAFALTMKAQQPAPADTVIADGYITRQQIESYSWFLKNYNAYKPAKTIIKKLRKHQDVSVLVILGTWCSDSKEHVPALLKICDESGLKELKFIGVNKKKVSSTVNIEPYKVTFVPLIILYRNGIEIERIIESPAKTIEKDLLKILRQQHK